MVKHKAIILFFILVLLLFPILKQRDALLLPGTDFLPGGTPPDDLVRSPAEAAFG